MPRDKGRGTSTICLETFLAIRQGGDVKGGARLGQSQDIRTVGNTGEHLDTVRAGEDDRIRAILLAVRLSLGSAIALGFARFSYALLLSPMKADLGWSFVSAT